MVTWAVTFVKLCGEEGSTRSEVGLRHHTPEQRSSWAPGSVSGPWPSRCIVTPCFLSVTLREYETDPSPFGRTSWHRQAHVIRVLCYDLKARETTRSLASVGLLSDLGTSIDNAETVASRSDVDEEVIWIPWWVGPRIIHEWAEYFRDRRYRYIDPCRRRGGAWSVQKMMTRSVAEL